MIGDICYANGKIPYIDRNCLIESYDKYVKGNYETINVDNYVELLKSIGVKPAKVGTRNSFNEDY